MEDLKHVRLLHNVPPCYIRNWTWERRGIIRIDFSDQLYIDSDKY